MRISYTDIAFSTEMQVILFFINIATTTVSYYWGANLVLQLLQKEISFKRKLIFSMISGILLNLLVVYGISWINGIIAGLNTLYIGQFAILTKNVLPFAYFVLYYLGINILSLSAIKSIKLMQYLYIYFICCGFVLRIVSRLLIVFYYDPRGWNYLRDIYILVIGTALIYILYRTISRAINKYKVNIVFSDNIIVDKIGVSLFANFMICCAVYMFVTLVYYYRRLDAVHCLLMLMFFLSYLIINILLQYHKIHKQNLLNRDMHIATFNESIEEFRGVKHDFNNILQTYSGYLALGAYDKLKVYHQKMVDTTLNAESFLDIGQRISESPSFFSLLIKKMNYAKKMGVSFDARLICNMEETHMDELDFTRVMAVLLDNAVEEAQMTEKKNVIFSAQIKPDASKLIIISNDSLSNVDIEKIFLPGHSTKNGHMGQGLAQVRNILSQYGNVTLNCTSLHNVFTVYLEIRQVL